MSTWLFLSHFSRQLPSDENFSIRFETVEKLFCLMTSEIFFPTFSGHERYPMGGPLSRIWFFYHITTAPSELTFIENDVKIEIVKRPEILFNYSVKSATTGSRHRLREMRSCADYAISISLDSIHTYRAMLRYDTISTLDATPKVRWDKP